MPVGVAGTRIIAMTKEGTFSFLSAGGMHGWNGMNGWRVPSLFFLTCVSAADPLVLIRSTFAPPQLHLSIPVQPFSNQASAARKELSAAQLRHAAKLARLSGLCYRPADQLSESLEQEGLHLISCGQTHFTR